MINERVSGEASASSHNDVSVNGPATVTFWGVHGTLPVPGERTTRYGGNTSCVSVEFANNQLLVFDAGSGIKNLSDYLLADNTRAKRISVLISHPHWDHINAFPFFAPLYSADHTVTIGGPAQGDRKIDSLISAQMDSVFFPITIDEFRATIAFQSLSEGPASVDGISINAIRLTHPGNCLGYRLNVGSRSLCYLTDNELYPANSPSFSGERRTRLIEFARGAEILVIDSTYFDHEYPEKIHWGHSCLSEVAQFAHQAQIQTLCLFHHDVAHSDDDIDRKLAFIRDQLAEWGSTTRCVAPKERDTFPL